MTLPTLERLGVDAPGDVSVDKVATRWFAAFSKATQENDIPALAALFTEDGSWKDILALTWDLRTLVGRDAITRMLHARLAPSALTDLCLHRDAFQEPTLQRPWPDLVFLRLYFGFRTKVGQGTGIAYLVPLPRGDWKAYALFTCLESLSEFPEKVCLRSSAAPDTNHAGIRLVHCVIPYPITGRGSKTETESLTFPTMILRSSSSELDTPDSRSQHDSNTLVYEPSSLRRSHELEMRYVAC